MKAQLRPKRRTPKASDIADSHHRAGRESYPSGPWTCRKGRIDPPHCPIVLVEFLETSDDLLKKVLSRKGVRGEGNERMDECSDRRGGGWDDKCRKSPQMLNQKYSLNIRARRRIQATVFGEVVPPLKREGAKVIMEKKA